MQNTGLLHHLELYVSNLRKSTWFWGWLLDELGYTEYQRWEEGRSWKKGDTYLVFVQTPKEHSQKSYHRRETGINHLAFHAESKAHVDSMTGKLRQHEVTILYPEDHPYAGGPDHYAVYFEDPDRIKVELVAPSSN